MCVLAVSSAKGVGKVNVSCSHVSSYFFDGFHRANARERDEAKRNRAALRSGEDFTRLCRRKKQSEMKQSEIERHCGVVRILRGSAVEKSRAR